MLSRIAKPNLLFAFAAVTLHSHLAMAQQLWDGCKSYEPETSIPACSQIIKNKNNSKIDLAAAYNNRGIAYAMNDDMLFALADYNNAIALTPRLVEAYYNRALAYSKINMHHEAMTDIETAIKINPNYARAYAQRGIFMMKGGKREGEALEMFAKALSIDTNLDLGSALSGDLKGGSGKKLFKQFSEAAMKRRLERQYASAITVYNLMANIWPDNPEVYSRRAETHFYRKEFSAAASDYQRAADKGAKGEAIPINICMARLYDRDYSKAEADCALARTTAGDKNSYPYQLSAKLYIETRKFAEAKAMADEAIRRNAKSNIIYFYRATALQGMGEVEPARSDFESASTLSPKSDLDRWAALQAKDRLKQLADTVPKGLWGFSGAGEYFSKTREPSLSACRRKCDNAGNCVHYSFDTWNKQCYLRARVNCVYKDPRFISGSRNLQVAKSKARYRVTRVRRKAYPDEAYKRIRVANFAACGRRCIRDDDCNGFNYYSRNRQCHLISRPSEFSDSPEAEVGLKRQSSTADC